ncbi:MAG TPA: peptide-methionine (S)-S-oxide reductase MsrA [bacterium]
MLVTLNAIPGLGGLGKVFAGEQAVQLPAPATDLPKQGAKGPQVAVIAGGCFWGVQGVYQHTKGVLNAVSGYAGGEAGTAHYEMVGSGRTGHAEAVEITYDPAQISYGEILRIFFSVAHDPTQLDRQGPDWGSQYRSHIYTTSAEQKKVADAYISQLGGAHSFKDKIVTRVDPLKQFSPAEGYHQDYMTLNPNQPYIVFNDLPKVANLRKMFPASFREKPVLVADNKK